jgi:hypothetical protein
MPNYRGGYSKNRREEIEEICDLRHLYDMPCEGCLFQGFPNCPKKTGLSVKNLNKNDKLPI